MRKTRFSEEQMAKILHATDKAADRKRLRQLEQENAWLKKVLIERVMDIEILEEVAARNW